MYMYIYTYSTTAVSQLLYHVCVDFLPAVHVGRGPGELQQLSGLVHHQGGEELTQLQQVAAEHPAGPERRRRWRRGDDLSDPESLSVRVVLPVYLLDVRGDFEEKAASFQDDQDQVNQKLLISHLKQKKLRLYTDFGLVFTSVVKLVVAQDPHTLTTVLK